MTVEPAQAALQHVLDVAQIYKENSVLKQGVPTQPERLVIGKMPAHVSQTTTATNPPSQPQQPAATPAATDKWKWVKTAALIGGSLLAGGGIPGAITALWPRTPVPPATTPDRPEVSLLQHLQEHGLHLPLKGGAQ